MLNIISLVAIALCGNANQITIWAPKVHQDSIFPKHKYACVVHDNVLIQEIQDILSSSDV